MLAALTRRPFVAGGRSWIVNKRWIHHNNLYNIAIARDLPDSFAADAISTHTTTDNNDNIVSMSLARQQHSEYLKVLRQHLPVLCLPALAEYPDCVFVEDTVVAVGRRAVITQPGHEARRGETSSIRQCLQQFGTDVTDMSTSDDKAFCDGGDVLYTGRHLFVGMSNRTNEAAIDVLLRVFHDDDDATTKIVPVPAIVQGNDVLHLKSAVTHIDETTLLVPEGNLGDTLIDTMRLTELGYTSVRIPNVLACNAVTVNGHIVAQDTPCEKSKMLLSRAAQERNMGITFVNTSELAKKDAALTCCSVLLSL